MYRAAAAAHEFVAPPMKTPVSLLLPAGDDKTGAGAPVSHGDY